MNGKNIKVEDKFKKGIKTVKGTRIKDGKGLVAEEGFF